MSNILKEYIKEVVRQEPKPHLIRLDETSFNRLVSTYFDYGFVIISANRTRGGYFGTSDITPEQEEELRKRNKKADAELKQDLRHTGFGYVPVWGGYKEKAKDPVTGETIMEKDPTTGEEKPKLVDTSEPEPSYIIVGKKAAGQEPADPEKLKALGMQLTTKYDQDTFLWKPPNKIDKDAYYITKDGSVDMTFSEPKSIDNLTKLFYTQMRNKGKHRYTLNEESMTYWVRQGPDGMQEAIKRYGEEFFRFKE